MSDRIVIEGLRVPCHIGVTEEERADPQDVIVDVEAELDLEDAARTDDLTATLDYGLLTEELAALVSGSRFKLLERLAGEIADAVLAHSGVDAVTVRVGKAEPPVEAEVGSIGVVLRRLRR